MKGWIVGDMARKTIQNKITSPELIQKVNPKNKQLVEDYLTYLDSIQRSKKTINGYRNDLDIFFVWNLQHNSDMFFVDVSKRAIVAYQNYLLNVNKNSPARVRRLKSTLSSLSNYIETVLDDEFEDYRPIIKKIENPVNQAVRKKTVFTDDQLQSLLDHLVDKKQYMKACCLALAMCSGRRKSELSRFKVSYFTDENVIYGSLYKTPEKIMTKGRGLGKPLTCYVLKKEFQPYFDLWMEQRKELGIDSEWLFVTKYRIADEFEQLDPDTLNSWAITFTNFLGVDFYWHSLRHFFTTHLSRLGLPDAVIQEIVGWESADMVKVYKDIDADEQLGKYFNENGIIANKKVGLADL